MSDPTMPESPAPSDAAKAIARDLAALRGPATEAVMLQDLAATLRLSRDIARAHASEHLDGVSAQEPHEVIHLGDIHVTRPDPPGIAPGAVAESSPGGTMLSKALQAGSLLLGGGGLASLALMAAGLIGNGNDDAGTTGAVRAPIVITTQSPPAPQPPPQPVQEQPAASTPRVEFQPGGIRLEVIRRR